MKQNAAAVAGGLCLIGGAAGPGLADPAFFLGGSLRFGAAAPPALGISLKVLSGDAANAPVLGLGGSWYPGRQVGAFGTDASVGYAWDEGAVLMGWDLMSKAPVLSLGTANTSE